NRSIDIIERLISKNFNDNLLYNNLIYLLLKTDRIDEANKYFIEKLSHLLITKDSDSAIYYATAGLVAFRNNDFEKGFELYKSSITLAKKFKNTHNKLLAMGNLLIECFRANIEEDKWK